MLVLGVKPLRYFVAFAVVLTILAVGVAFSKSRCGPDDPFFASGDPWVHYFGSALFVFFGLGAIACEMIGHWFAKLGWEPDYKPISMRAENSNLELPVRERLAFFGLIGGVGLWQWIVVNGCDVIVVPMKGIAA
jgi:hypothetical protein